MSDGRLGRPCFYDVYGRLRCGCGFRMDFFECVEEDEDGRVWEDLSQWQCRSCNYAVFGGADMGCAQPGRPSWQSMIDQCLEQGLQFEQPYRSPWIRQREPASACLVAFHIMVLEAQCP